MRQQVKHSWMWNRNLVRQNCIRLRTIWQRGTLRRKHRRKNLRVHPVQKQNRMRRKRQNKETVLAEPEQMNFDPTADQPEPLRYVGEVFRTYILAERGDELCLIDKHAAHERQLYEKLAANYGNVPSQMLLEPAAIDLVCGGKAGPAG